MFLNRLLTSFFPLLQMAFDPTHVETAGKTQLKESYKGIFPKPCCRSTPVQDRSSEKLTLLKRLI